MDEIIKRSEGEGGPFEYLIEEGLPHWLVCIDTKNRNSERPATELSIIHISGYEKEPTQEDRDHLIKELSEDDELGLTDRIYDKDFIIVYWNEDSFQ